MTVEQKADAILRVTRTMFPEPWRWIRGRFHEARENPDDSDECALCYCLTGAMRSAVHFVHKRPEAQEVSGGYRRAMERVWDRIVPRVRDKIGPETKAALDRGTIESRVIYWNDRHATYPEVVEVIEEALNGAAKAQRRGA